jgi:hypothetical protein
MDQRQFEQLLDKVAEQLTEDMRTQPADEWLAVRATKALSYEQHVRERLSYAVIEMGEDDTGYKVDLNPSGQTFPDVPCGRFGVEVKFTMKDTWVSVANSIRETKRAAGVDTVYLMFGKMGGEPQTRWMLYEDCVVHVRTTHEPRFQVDLSGEKESLFSIMGISYDEFRKLDIIEKMPYIREYARKIHPDGRLWWLEDTASGEEHSTDIDLVPYTSLDNETKNKYRAEATLLVPSVVADGSGGSGRKKTAAFRDVAMYFMTYRGVLLYNARDINSAGSVGNRIDGVVGLQKPMENAAGYLDDALFDEYWGEKVAREDRLAWWLEKADGYATSWEKKPSECMFLDYQRKRSD